MTHSNGSFSNESFTWDSNGNETGTGYTTGTDNEQTASPGYTYTYDNAGEMTSETQTSTGDVWTYGYDFRGRMVTAVEKTSGGTTLESVTYSYDAPDNRIGMDENSTPTWTLYASGTPIMDFNSSGSLTMRYLWGPTGIVARQTSGSTVSWYLADALGTVRDLINNSGAIIDHVDFSAFGTVLGESSPTSGDRFVGFAMLQRDTVTGLNLAVYRDENPGTGRWGTQDPLGFAANDSDLYRYVQNKPTDLSDPVGEDAWGAAGGAFEGGLLGGSAGFLLGAGLGLLGGPIGAGVGGAVGETLGGVGGAIWGGVEGSSEVTIMNGVQKGFLPGLASGVGGGLIGGAIGYGKARITAWLTAAAAAAAKRRLFRQKIIDELNQCADGIRKEASKAARGNGTGEPYVRPPVTPRPTVRPAPRPTAQPKTGSTKPTWSGGPDPIRWYPPGQPPWRPQVPSQPGMWRRLWTWVTGLWGG